MEKPPQPRYIETGKLNSRRAEKIAAIEGLYLSSRMARILDDAASGGLSGDDTLTLIKGQFVARKPD